MIVGKAWQSERRLEVSLRATKDAARVTPEELLETIHKLLDKSSSL